MRLRAMMSVLAVGVLLFAGLLTCVNVAVPASALPLAPAWQALPDVPEPKAQGEIAAAADGVIYVFGGVKNITYPSQEYNITIPDSYAFDTSSNTWTRIADMLYGVRAGVAMAGDDGRVYVFGGYNASMTNYTQIYDPETNSWSLGASMPHADSFVTGAVDDDGRMYVIGGADLIGYVQIYDPVLDSWTVGTNMPSPRFAGAAVSIAGADTVLYLGGSASWGTSSTNCWAYDIYFNSWSSIADMPVSRTAGAAVAASDGLVYYMGGGNQAWNTGGTMAGQEFYGETLVYTWSNNTWSTAEDLPYGARYGMATGTMDGKVWYFGGNTNTTMFRHGSVLEVMRITVTLSSSSAVPGSSVLMYVTPYFAYLDVYLYVISGYLTSPTGYFYAASTMQTPIDTPFAFELKVPSASEAGVYTVVISNFMILNMNYYPIHWDIGNMTFTVTTPVPISDQIAALQAEIDALQAALASGDANVSALSFEVAVMQAKLDGIIAGMAAAGQAQGASMIALNATLDDLQAQLDDFKTQIDRVESKANTGGTFGMLTLVLVVVIIGLLVVVVMLARRKPPVPPPPL